MCEGPTEYPYPTAQVDSTPRYTFDLPVVGQMVAQGVVTASDRPRCTPGEHDYELVGEPARVSAFGYPDRLILYCHRCGDVIVHPVESNAN